MNRLQRMFGVGGLLVLSIGGSGVLFLRRCTDKEARKLDKFYRYNVIKFEGNLSEYERFKGYECEILGPQIDLGKDPSTSPLKEKLRSYYEDGIEAIVNYRSWSYYEWGLPIRKKRPK